MNELSSSDGWYQAGRQTRGRGKTRLSDTKIVWVISKLHRAHGAARQGPKLSSSRIERQSEVAQAGHYNAEAARLGLRGAKKWAFMCENMRKDPRSDPSWLKRLLKPAS